MTKHVGDEGLPRILVPLEDADRLVLAVNVKLLNSSELGVCHANVQSIRQVPLTKPTILKTQTSRTKLDVFKGKMGKIMRRLYDLESDNTPEKPINIDLGVALYQMEDY